MCIMVRVGLLLDKHLDKGKLLGSSLPIYGEWVSF
jgi:hypothetical protein